MGYCHIFFWKKSNSYRDFVWDFLPLSKMVSELPILANSDFVKHRSKLFGWILFVAGVWAFSKGGVEVGGEVDLFSLIVLDICKIEVFYLIKQGQGNQCRTLWVKFESPVVKFSNCVTNLDILRTNFQPFPAIKMSHQNLS